MDMNSNNRETDRRWVIPSLDVRLPQPSFVVNRETIRYWMVELTSTDGEILNFYVKAKTSIDAMVKANDNKYRLQIPRLCKRKLILID
jgi:hypothetical protein